MKLTPLPLVVLAMMQRGLVPGGAERRENSGARTKRRKRVAAGWVRAWQGKFRRVFPFGDRAEEMNVCFKNTKELV